MPGFGISLATTVLTCTMLSWLCSCLLGILGIIFSGRVATYHCHGCLLAKVVTALRVGLQFGLSLVMVSCLVEFVFAIRQIVLCEVLCLHQHLVDFCM